MLFNTTRGHTPDPKHEGHCRYAEAVQHNSQPDPSTGPLSQWTEAWPPTQPAIRHYTGRGRGKGIRKKITEIKMRLLRTRLRRSGGAKC